jgi:hypothetical protein
MECIQRKFRLKQVNKWLSILDLHTIDISFDDFTLLIQQKNILQRVEYILSLINQISNYGNSKPVTCNTFLAAFVISGYPDDILSKPVGPIHKIIEVNLNNNILKISRELIMKFNSLSSINDVKIFYKMLITYNEMFKAWKTMDIQSLVHTLTVSYYDLDNIIVALESEISIKDGYTIEDKTEYLFLCREHQEDIIEKIIFLNGQKYFNDYKNEEISIDESLRKHIQDTLYKVYWDILDKELKTEPPIFDQLIKILSEIRDLLCEFVPNNPTIQEEIRDKIDPDLIRNMVEHQAFDDENLYVLVMYMISLVKKFQPPIMDKNVEDWEKGLHETFTKPIIYSEFLCIFLQSIFNMIQNIKEYLIIIQNELV